MIPSRGLLLVKPVETEEALGSIILIADTRERMTLGQCEVIAVGAPAECDPTRSRAERKCDRTHTMHTPACDGGCDWMSEKGVCSTRRTHLFPVRVGDWLLVRPRAFIDSPHPERKEWFVHQDDVIAILGRSNESA
jgi:hypothetical protein